MSFAGLSQPSDLDQIKACGDRAVLPSMMLAEQYFSWLRAMARSTAAAECPCP